DSRRPPRSFRPYRESKTPLPPPLRKGCVNFRDSFGFNKNRTTGNQIEKVGLDVNKGHRILPRSVFSYYFADTIDFENIPRLKLNVDLNIFYFVADLEIWRFVDKSSRENALSWRGSSDFKCFTHGRSKGTVKSEFIIGAIVRLCRFSARKRGGDFLIRTSNEGNAEIVE